MFNYQHQSRQQGHSSHRRVETQEKGYGAHSPQHLEVQISPSRNTRKVQMEDTPSHPQLKRLQVHGYLYTAERANHVGLEL